MEPCALGFWTLLPNTYGFEVCKNTNKWKIQASLRHIYSWESKGTPLPPNASNCRRIWWWFDHPSLRPYFRGWWWWALGGGTLGLSCHDSPWKPSPNHGFSEDMLLPRRVCLVFALTSTAQQLTGHAPNKKKSVAGTPEVEIVTTTEDFESRNNFKGEEKLPFGERLVQVNWVDLWGCAFGGFWDIPFDPLYIYI